MPRKFQYTTSATFGNMKWVWRQYDDGAYATRKIDLGTGKTLWTVFYDGRGHIFRKYFEDGIESYANANNDTAREKNLYTGEVFYYRHGVLAYSILRSGDHGVAN